jgi:hypothetical protein
MRRTCRQGAASASGRVCARRLHAGHVERDRRAARRRGRRFQRVSTGLLPIELETDPASWKEGSNLPNANALRKKIILTDGGVYDNMGLESLVDNADIVLVSDAGRRWRSRKIRTATTCDSSAECAHH